MNSSIMINNNTTTNDETTMQKTHEVKPMSSPLRNKQRNSVKMDKIDDDDMNVNNNYKSRTTLYNRKNNANDIRIDNTTMAIDDDDDNNDNDEDYDINADIYNDANIKDDHFDIDSQYIDNNTYNANKLGDTIKIPLSDIPVMIQPPQVYSNILNRIFKPLFDIKITTQEQSMKCAISSILTLIVALYLVPKNFIIMILFILVLLIGAALFIISSHKLCVKRKIPKTALKKPINLEKLAKLRESLRNNSLRKNNN